MRRHVAQAQSQQLLPNVESTGGRTPRFTRQWFAILPHQATRRLPPRQTAQPPRVLLRHPRPPAAMLGQWMQEDMLGRCSAVTTTTAMMVEATTVSLAQAVQVPLEIACRIARAIRAVWPSTGITMARATCSQQPNLDSKPMIMWTRQLEEGSQAHQTLQLLSPVPLTPQALLQIHRLLQSLPVKPLPQPRRQVMVAQQLLRSLRSDGSGHDKLPRSHSVLPQAARRLQSARL